MVESLFQNITSETTCLCISDGSLIPLMAAHLGARHVYTIENNHLCKRIIKEFIEHNRLQESITVLDKDPTDIGEKDLQEKVTYIHTCTQQMYMYPTL